MVRAAGVRLIQHINVRLITRLTVKLKVRSGAFLLAPRAVGVLTVAPIPLLSHLLKMNRPNVLLAGASGAKAILPLRPDGVLIAVAARPTPRPIVRLKPANGAQAAAAAGARQDLEQLVRQLQPTPKLNVQPRPANGARAAGAAGV